MLRVPAACARRAALALLAGAAALPAATAQIACLNNETLYATNVTHLNFQNSSVTTNTLHIPGGEIRYDGIGIVKGRNASLVVTDIGGNYSDITESWDVRGLDASENGKQHALGKINLQTVRGEPNSGNGKFQFCIVDSETDETLEAEKFVFTLYDLDQRNGTNLEPPVVEQALFDGQQAGALQIMPDNDVDLGCEDDSMPPCAPGIRTRFQSKVIGTGGDNPENPNFLTEKQIKRSIAITFVDASCWEFEYDIYCPVEQDDYVGTATRCSGKYRQGGNFIFAGTSERLVLEGVCLAASLVTSMPSLKPSPVPSIEASLFPSVEPSLKASTAPSLMPSLKASAAPSVAPLCARNDCCIDCFCCGPGTSWDSVAGTCVQNSESTTGDDDNSCGQYSINTCYNDSVCQGAECCGVETSLDLDPEYDKGDRCLCYGNGI